MKTTIISSLILYLLCMQVYAQDNERLISEGRRLADERAYVSQIEVLTKSIELLSMSKRAPLLNERGAVYQKINNHHLAIHDFNEAIKIDNHNSLYYLNRANSYYAIEEWENALYDYNKYLDIDNNKQIEALLGRARTNLNLKRNRKALDDCESVIKLLPSNSRRASTAYSIRGLIRSQEGYHEEALKDLKKAIELNPEDAEAFFNLGTHYQNIAKNDFNRLDLATEAYSSAIQLDPFYIQAYFARAMVRLQRGNEIEAKSDVRKILQTTHVGGRRFYKAYALRALLNYNLQDIRTYEADLNLYLNNASKATDLCFLAELCWRYGKEFPDMGERNILLQGEKALRRAIQFDNSYDSNYLLAQILARRNKLPEAREFADKALQLARRNRLDTKQANELLARIDAENQDKTAPVVSILSPVSQMRGVITIEQSDRITVIGTARDDSGIAEIFINGNRAKLECNDHRNNICTFSGEASIIDEKTLITVRAYDIRGNQTSHSFTVKREKPSTPESLSFDPKEHGRLLALIISINEYDHWLKLNNPIRDGRALGKSLKELYGAEVEYLDNPTKEQIMVKLADYGDLEYTPKDRLMIFYAGHGHINNAQSLGYLVGKDGKAQGEDRAGISYIMHGALRDQINAIPCRHIFVMLDACFAGTFDEMMAMRGGRSVNKDRNEYITNKMSKLTRRYISSSSKQEAPDGLPGQHSPFMQKILEILKTSGGDDKILNLSEIWEHIKSLPSQPQIGSFGNNEFGSDFLFIAK